MKSLFRKFSDKTDLHRLAPFYLATTNFESFEKISSARTRSGGRIASAIIPRVILATDESVHTVSSRTYTNRMRLPSATYFFFSAAAASGAAVRDEARNGTASGTPTRPIGYTSLFTITASHLKREKQRESTAFPASRLAESVPSRSLSLSSELVDINPFARLQGCPEALSRFMAIEQISCGFNARSVPATFSRLENPVMKPPYRRY